MALKPLHWSSVYTLLYIMFRTMTFYEDLMLSFNQKSLKILCETSQNISENIRQMACRSHCWSTIHVRIMDCLSFVEVARKIVKIPLAPPGNDLFRVNCRPYSPRCGSFSPYSTWTQRALYWFKLWGVLMINSFFTVNIIPGKYIVFVMEKFERQLNIF